MLISNLSGNLRRLSVDANEWNLAKLIWISNTMPRRLFIKHWDNTVCNQKSEFYTCLKWAYKQNFRKILTYVSEGEGTNGISFIQNK